MQNPIIISILCAIICAVFPLQSNSINNRVLVIGASGRVGSSVVNKLISRNIPVKAFVRDKSSISALFTNNNENARFDIIEGNVMNLSSLIEASKDCDSIICVHGARPIRFAKLTDIFTKPDSDLLHPYNVNYIGIKNIIEAMKINGVRKIVRITGALIGRDEMNLFKAVFNLILSFAVKWHEQAEIAIRESGLDYTILRPTGLVSIPPAIETKRSLILDKDHVVNGPEQLSISDVADLCIISINNLNLSNCTTVCSSSKVDTKGPFIWDTLIDKVDRDTDALVAKNHMKGVIALVTLLFTCAGLALHLFAMAIQNIGTFMVK